LGIRMSDAPGKRRASENKSGVTDMKSLKTPSSQKSADILLTAKQMAERLSIALSTAYQWGYERRLPTVKLGRSVRFRASEVEKLILRHERPALRQSACASMGGAL
jgi:excisionase family DNA binding protein